MGVVRREDDWRLEKREDGVYEITYKKEPQERILTAEYEPGLMDNYGIGAIPVHNVESYSAVESLFDKRAKGHSSSSLLDPVLRLLTMDLVYQVSRIRSQLVAPTLLRFRLLQTMENRNSRLVVLHLL